jgi:large subunit ribosomal protein L7/L12
MRISSAAIMKFFTKVSASCLLSLGLLCLTATASKLADLEDKEINTQDRQEIRSDAFLGIGFSVSFLTQGGLMLWGLRHNHYKNLQQRLNSIFYEVLKADSGRITVLRLAMETQLSGEQAKQFLDKKAKEFNASFETSDKGDISYRFDV